MTVTACFITRNHDRSITRAIQSVIGFTSRVLVVDTGSSDQTVQDAKRIGADVQQFDWVDDFSVACNFTLDHCNTDWILWMNPDEELDPAGIPNLQNAMADSTLFAGQIRVQQQREADRPGYGIAEWQFRLFRRDPAIRYQHRVHPGFVRLLPELAAERKQKTEQISAVLTRHAYLSQITPEKMRWVVRLLEAELRDYPGQLPTLIELGRNLLWLNDSRGHEVLAQAAEQVRQAAKDPAPPHQDVGMLFEYLLTVSPELSQSAISREMARELAIKWFPATPPVLWAVAGERFTAGDYAAALPILERLVEMGRLNLFDPAGGFDPEIIGSAAQMNLAACWIHLGQPQKAQAQLAPLLHDPRYRERATQFFQIALKTPDPK